MPEIAEKDLPQNLKTLWLKALTAVQSGNTGYAVSLLQAVLKEAPAFLDGRKILREAQMKEFGPPKKKSGLFGLRTDAMGIMKLANQAKKDPEGTLPLIEKELEKDPYNEAAGELLFDTFMRMDLHPSAAFALETVRKGHPENSKLMHKLADFYLIHDQPLTAADVFNDIIKHHPTDSAAIKGSKDASARASMQKQKWDENTDMRALLRNQDEMERLEKESRSGLTRAQLEERRDRIIEKYNADPNHLLTVKDLASIYEQLEDFTNAQAFYEWAFSLSNGDVALQLKAGQMKDRAAEAHIRELEAAAAADPHNEELQAALTAHRAERRAIIVEEAQKRVDQNPTDPQLRYELGNALYNAGDYSAAIPHLQQATRNPHIRTKVLLLLGRTFKAKGMFDLSIKQLADALADLHAMDNTKKEVLYEKGLIHQDMGDKASALDCFKQIYEVDYGYRDVAHRVESSYQ